MKTLLLPLAAFSLTLLRVTSGHAADLDTNNWRSLFPPQPEPMPAPILTRPARPLRTFTTIESLHTSYQEDFASRPGFGSGRLPFLPPEDNVAQGGRTYHLNAPDLLGLVDEPVAYMRRSHGVVTISDLSRKEARAFLARRALTAAESEAVTKLRAGLDFVTTPLPAPVARNRALNSSGGLLVVGALRATAQCAECHQVKEGTLLGAFAYTLSPAANSAPALLTLRGRSAPTIQLNAPTEKPATFQIETGQLSLGGVSLAAPSLFNFPSVTDRMRTAAPVGGRTNHLQASHPALTTSPNFTANLRP